MKSVGDNRRRFQLIQITLVLIPQIGFLLLTRRYQGSVAGRVGVSFQEIRASGARNIRTGIVFRSQPRKSEAICIR